MATRWNLHADPQTGAILDRRCAETLAGLHGAHDADRLRFLCDTRATHRALFADTIGPDAADVPGTYRGTTGTTLADTPRAVFLARRLPGLRFRDMCLPAAGVFAAMDDLAIRLSTLWHAPPDPTDDAAFAALAAISHRFFAIHPFLDGNGHIYRLMLPVLAARLGLTMRPTWTLHRRPYDHTFSLGLQWYPDHPEVLACYLRKWMDRA